MISELKIDYNNLEIGSKTGKEAIYHYVGKLKNNKAELDGVFVLEYRYILESVLYIERSIRTMQLTDEQKRFLQYSLAFFVDNKLNPQTNRTIINIKSVINDDNKIEKIPIYKSAEALSSIDWTKYLSYE